MQLITASIQLSTNTNNMATLELNGPVTIHGTTYPAAKVIVLSPQQRQRTTVQPILPKSEGMEKENSLSSPGVKRRIHFSKKALTHPRPHTVTKRNTRERNRVRVVNQGETISIC